MASPQMQAHPAASLYSLLSSDPHGKAGDSPRHSAAAMAALPKLGSHDVSGAVDTRFEARTGYHAFAPSITTHHAAFPASAGSSTTSHAAYASSSVGVGASVRVNVGHPPALGEGAGKPGVLSSRSPSSPSSFFTQSESQFGLNHLLEAAEQVRPSVRDPRFFKQEDDGRASPNKRAFPMGPLPSLASTVGAIAGYSTSEASHQHQHQHQHQHHQHHQQLPFQHQVGPKRARVDSDVSMDMQPSYHVLPNLPRQTMVYPSIANQDAHHQPRRQQETFQQHLGQPMTLRRVDSMRVPREEVLSPSSTGGASPADSISLTGRRRLEPQMVWETVLSTGKFPEDVCLSEHNHNVSQSPVLTAATGDDLQLDSVKAGRWSYDEKQFAEALIQSVRNGESVLPPNMSLRQFIADNLQCKAMRVSKKFPSLNGEDGQQESSDSDASQRAEPFNALSLKSIMNNDAGESETASYKAAPAPLMRQDSSSGKKNARVLKRSDYSQHGVVRSGRWSVEEENYARAMIEAFKAGYLPLHGNVSLRKFLSEVLVCHPMRISKKFVGYVRKYHWYRIAAGKCDPEARRQSLQTLCSLERAFWTSLQQSNEWTQGGYQQV